MDVIENTLIGTIIGAAVGAFLSWGLIKLVTYYVLRDRLKSFIVTLVNIQLIQIKSSRAWLDKYTKNLLSVGSIVDQAPYYTKDELHDLKSISVEHLLYLTKLEQIQLTNLIVNITEVEALFDGFCNTLMELQKEGKVLSEDKYDFLILRASRILELTEQFPDTLKNLETLKFGYKKTNPEDLVKTKD
ncbi:hypothetical protein QSE00_21610 [Arenibacter sp. M-2]|uniref:hypothetical protein n=1 Tax=Arenibacter sp. M-2 TaxID=3053612 RepID=UPI00256FBCA4|nr:hypothetical protein [Arenibacter sp. M-2]MDL5514425.1 hypothetical protein [Arenibacter sp. M-2]